jgi:hypothetical protein
MRRWGWGRLARTHERPSELILAKPASRRVRRVDFLGDSVNIVSLLWQANRTNATTGNSSVRETLTGQTRDVIRLKGQAAEESDRGLSSRDSFCATIHKNRHRHPSSGHR